MSRKLFPVPSSPIAEVQIELLEEILAAAKDGSLTAFAIVGKQNGFSKWYGFQALTRDDRMNILGQMETLKHQIIAVEEESK